MSSLPIPHRLEGLALVPVDGSSSAEKPEARRTLLMELQDIEAPVLYGEAVVEMAPAHAPRPHVRGGKIGTVADLEQALSELGTRPIRRLGEALIDAGFANSVQVEAALQSQKIKPGRPLGEILIAAGAVTAEQVKSVIVEKLGIPVVDARRFPTNPEARKKIPADLCARHKMLPLHIHEGAVVVALDNPLSEDALQAARFASGSRVIAVLAGAEEIRDALRSRAAGSWSSSTPSLDLTPAPALAAPGAATASASAAPIFGGDSLEFDLSGVEELASRLNEELVRHDTKADEKEDEAVRESDSTLVKLVNKVILDAHESGGSDIHIEPGAGKSPVRVRIRRDGVLTEYAELPSRFRAAIVSRIKIMANLNIAERRKPQDGKIDFSKFGPARLELRVATIPTNNGIENVILRLLAAAEPISLSKLGIEDRVLTRMKELAERPHGLMLVCGPTGSGKTTTLHSLIGHINTPERKIWTAEDPVEITQHGLAQVQVNPRIDWTFAAALRSFLRADPDVIMVGEMRDAETASTAVEASLTGHLVLSTLHTNSAAETVTRLLDLGVDPFNFGDSLLSVLAQRLVRRVCPGCAVASPAGDEALQSLAAEFVAGTQTPVAQQIAGWRSRTSQPVMARGAGCDQCSGSGYRGRLGIYEFMEVTPALRALIQSRAPTERIRACAVSEGMRTLKQDGIEKILAGQTTVEQIRGACP